MRTLVIHPDDRTTDFLKVIYEGRDWTVYNSWRPSVKEILKLIRAHDRVIAMGHGGAYGLIGFSHVFMNEKVIRALRKKDCVCIWCHANLYVERERMKGFSTSMFCSEYSECHYENIRNVKDGMVEESNMKFSSIMSKYIDENIKIMYNKVVEEYQSVGNTNPVAEYNNAGLLLFQ